MPVKISQLPTIATPTTAALLPIVESGVTSQTTLGALVKTSKAFSQAGTGAVARTVQSKERDVVSVRDFGAVGDGVTNDAAAFQAAITFAQTIGGAVYIPMPESGGNYYMGSTALTITSNLRLYGAYQAPLVWDAAFASTGIIVTGNYCVLENLILWKPKSVGVPNSAIIAIDLRGPLNVVCNVRIDQTSAGNNSGWYTGVKVGGIECSINHCELYAYSVAILYTAGAIKNDLTIIDTVATSQASAVLKTLDAGAVSVIGCDFEAFDTALYVIWLTTTSVEGAGCSVVSSYLQGGTDSCLFADGNASFPIRGLTITGCEVFANAAAVNAISLSNTKGVSLTGNYLVGVTNYLKLTNTNSMVLERGNYKSGVLSATGTYVLDSYDTASFTATLTGVAATITGTGYYTINGNAVVLDLPELAGTSNTTSKSITGIPAAVRPTTTKNVSIAAIDNGGTRAMSIGTVNSSGVLVCYPTPGAVSSGWTNSGTALVSPLSITYTLN